MRSIALVLTLTFALVAPGAEAAQKQAPAQLQKSRVSKRPGLLSRGLTKTGRTIANTVAGILGGTLVTTVAVKYGGPMDFQSYALLFSTSSYLSNEGFKAATNKLFRGLEGAPLIKESARDRVSGLVAAGLSGILGEPFITPQWIGKGIAKLNAAERGFWQRVRSR